MSQEIKNEELNTRQTTPAKMTYEEFLAQADEDVPAEWVDGSDSYRPASQSTRLVFF